MKRLLAAICMLALSVPALAGDEPQAEEKGRRIDFTTVIQDQDGKPLTECADSTDRECKQTREVTLGSVTFKALTNIDRDPAGRPIEISPDEGVKRGQLGFRVYKAASAKLTAEEIALIKRQIGKAFNPMVVVRAFEILDPNSK